MARAGFLVVDDDVSFQCAIGRLLGKFGAHTPAHSIVEADQRVRERKWTGILVDVRLPDGDGVEWFSSVACASVPALVCTAYASKIVRRRALALGAIYCDKRDLPGAVAGFARTAIASEFLDRTASRLVGNVADRFALPAMLTRVLALEVRRVPRGSWPHILNITTNTRDTYIKRLRALTGTPLQKLAAPLSEQALAATTTVVPASPPKKRAKANAVGMRLLLGRREFGDAVAVALRGLHDDEKLARSSLVQHTCLFSHMMPSEVRQVFADARGGFDMVGKNGLRARILDECFLLRTDKQLQVARTLSTSLATIRRESPKAVHRLVATLWVREQEARHGIV